MVCTDLHRGYVRLRNLNAGSRIHEGRGIEPSARMAWRPGAQDKYNVYEPPGCSSGSTSSHQISLSLIILKREHEVLAVEGSCVYNDDTMAGRTENDRTVRISNYSI